MFAEYPCCRAFTDISDYKSVLEFFKRHKNISLETIPKINAEEAEYIKFFQAI